MIEIEQVSGSELLAFPEFPALCRAYARESAHPQLGEALPNIGLYRSAEAAGRLRLLAAVDDGRLAGFLVGVVGTLPHHVSTPCFTVDAVYASPAVRGVGYRLLLAARRLARQAGCRVFIASAPAGSRAAEFYRRSAAAEQSTFIWSMEWRRCV